MGNGVVEVTGSVGYILHTAIANISVSSMEPTVRLQLAM